MITKAYVCTKNAMFLAKEKISNRDGMEMLQMVLILGIAVALGAAFYVLMTTQFSEFSTGFKTKMTNMFAPPTP